MGAGFLRFYAIYVTFPAPTKFIRPPTGRINLFDLGWKRKRGYVSKFVPACPYKEKKDV